MALTLFMRLSLQKGAHAALSYAACRKSGAADKLDRKSGGWPEVWFGPGPLPMTPLSGSNEDLAARVNHCLLQPNPLFGFRRMDCDVQICRVAENLAQEV